MSPVSHRHASLTATTVSADLPIVTAALAFDALGDPTRRAVFELLRGGPCAVVELASQLPVSRPAVSQHLRVLKAPGSSPTELPAGDVCTR